MSHVIKTDRLLLRPFRDADGGAVVGWLNDYKVCKWLLRVPYPCTIADARAFLRHIAGANRHTLAIARNETLIGSITIGDMPGYWVARRHWGIGYASEARRAMVRGYFQRGGEVLKSAHFAGNTASRRVLRKLGFGDGAVRLVFAKARNQHVDLRDMTLNRSDWEYTKCQ